MGAQREPEESDLQKYKKMRLRWATLSVMQQRKSGATLGGSVPSVPTTSRRRVCASAVRVAPPRAVGPVPAISNRVAVRNHGRWTFLEDF